MNAPPYPIYPELKSERILLKAFTVEDAPNVVEITHYQRIRAKDATEAAEMILKVHERYQQGDGIHWGILDRATNQFVGCCGFYRGFANESGEVGYMMHENFRGHGYMTEAVSLAVKFGFEGMKLKKIFAVTGQKNLASQNVLRKNGFVAAEIREDGDLVFHLVR